MARIQRGGAEGGPRLLLCDFTPTATLAERSSKLAELTTRLALASAPCSSVAPAGSFNLLLIEAPEVDATELKAAVRWRIKDLIDFHIDDAVIDVFDIPGQEQRGRAKLMYVVAARSSTIREHIEQLEGRGIDLAIIDIPELAQRNVAALLPEDHNGVALLHLGRDSGLLTLTRKGELFLSRTFDVGTQMLGEAAAGSSPETGLADELERLLEMIVLEVQRSLDYYESHFSLPAVGGLVIVPPEEQIPGLMGFMANSLGVPVRMLDLNNQLELAEPLSEAMQTRCLAAIGAALREEERAL